MRVFIGEYVCGGGMRRRGLEGIDPSLRAEGAAMLSALAADASKCAELSIPIDPRICPTLPMATLHGMDVHLPLWGQWVRAAQGCDAAILIVPESNGTLAKAVGILRAAGVNVIASTGDFLRATSDKYQTSRIFNASAVPHPITYNPADPRSIDRLRGHARFVVKPRDGCGAQQILVFEDLDLALSATSKAHILQGFVPGRPISIAAIVGQNALVTLPSVSQNIAPESCSYRGGCGPLVDDDQRRATALAQKALAAMPPSPRGFIGFDLVLSDEPGGDVVVEVNSRLTTSYVGIRHMVTGNLAARLLGQECGPVQCRTPAHSVKWTSAGEVWVHENACTDL